MRPIIQKRRPLRPAGMERASGAAKSRRVADGHRYQVNDYADGRLVWDASRERGWPADPEERGALLGFDRPCFQGP